MIYLKENWDQVRTLDDVLKIINEHLGYEFSKKVKEIFHEFEEEVSEKEEITREREKIIEATLKDIRDMQSRLDVLEERLEDIV